MPLNYSISTRTNKSKSLLYKAVNITNDGRNISYKTINKFYKHLLDEGWEKDKICIRIMNPQREFTIKALRADMYDTLDQYYRNKVPNPSKFTNQFEAVEFLIYDY